MKVVILAGGFGTRITEESQYKPKPMIEIGGKPILVHIMEYFAKFGHTDFIICAGYKQEKIKEYFLNSEIYDAKVVEYANGRCLPLETKEHTGWKVTVVDTGVGTMTGGRLTAIRNLLNPNEPFFMTYGDGLADVNLDAVAETLYQNSASALGVMTCVKPESRYGVVSMNEEGMVTSFREKSANDIDWINGGFMCLEPEALDYIHCDEMFEGEPLARLAEDGHLFCYKHTGHWQCMDTLRDKEKLEAEIKSGHPFWR